MDGILVLNKPPGPTSHDMVDLVRTLTGVKRVGHGGTLDPAASGVLPMLLGQAARVSEYLLSARKVYLAEVRLGIATDTYDAQGRVTAEADPSSVTRDRVVEELGRLRSVTRQTPPMYSAVKYKGKRLYKLARAGVQVERESRQVQVYHIALTAWAFPSFAMEVECSAGTYIRSLAHDLGANLGCGAHLTSLVRSRVGPFGLADALTTEALFDAVHGGHWQEAAYALDWVLLGLPALVLSPEEEGLVRQGRRLPAEGMAGSKAPSGPCRAYGGDGRLVALLSLEDGGTWQPRKVFAA